MTDDLSAELERASELHKNRMNETVLKRQEYNRQILRILTDLVEKWPDGRFSQILLTSGAVREDGAYAGVPIHWKDEFYVESEVILKRMQGK